MAWIIVFSHILSFNNKTPLYLAVKSNNVECVDVLCKQTQKISIEKQDIDRALTNDTVKILKFLLCGLFGKYQISCWTDVQNLESSNMISINQIKSMISHCKNNDKSRECYEFLNGLFSNSYERRNFSHIVFKLDYNLKPVIMHDDSIVNEDDSKDNEISSLYEIKKDLGNGTFGRVELGAQ